jgi:hypothetical protein
MRKVIVAVTASIVALGIASPAAAFEGGGRKPSEASTINWGQHYTGQLNNHKEDANYEGEEEVALWRLPSVSSHDQIVVNWHGLPFTHNSNFPVCMMLAQGINDYSWGTVFHGGSCESPRGFELSGSGTAATQITIQSTDTAGNTYLEFWAYANRTPTSGEQETFPYDFSVEAPRHALTLNFPSVKTVPANGTLSASVTGATGLPAPDGLVYTLTANWEHNGVWVGTGTSIGGQIAFQLALPEAAFDKSVRFIVSRAPDAEYQAVESPAMRARVTKPTLPAESSACKTARAHAHVLARQLRRLKRHERFARGATRRRVHRQARRVGREFRAASKRAASACASG